MIRPANTEDIPQIRAIAGEAFPSAYRDILSPEQIDYMMEWMYSEDSLLGQMTRLGHRFLIEDGCGYASFRFDRRDAGGRAVFHLEKLYVLPECQGRGLGRRLFEKVKECIGAEECGPAVMELNVNRRNGAVAFYEHLGMCRARSGDFPIGGGFYMNDYIMSVPVFCDNVKC